MILGQVTSYEEYHSHYGNSISQQLSKAYECHDLYGVGKLCFRIWDPCLFCFFPFCFPAGNEIMQDHKLQVLASSISQITTPGQYASKTEQKSQQNRKAKKQSGKLCVPMLILIPSVHPLQ